MRTTSATIARVGRGVRVPLVLSLASVACLRADPRDRPASQRDLAAKEARFPVAQVARGPVPDFAPLAEVRTHVSLVLTEPGLPRLLSQILGPRSVVEYDAVDDDSLIWMRDYTPIYVRGEAGELEVVSYLSGNANRTALANRKRSGYGPARAADTLLPLVHENGNLITNGRFVFVSEQILEENSELHDDKRLRMLGYRPRGRDEVVGLLAQALRRPQADIFIVPKMPGEETGHVDTWLMFVDERTAVVPRIARAAIERLPADERALADNVATFLDVEADALEALELRVLRLPMLPPLTVPAEDDEAGASATELLFLTPSNALLMHVAGRRNVLLPSFDLTSIAPHLADLQGWYEETWAKVLATAGWQPWFSESIELARLLGLIRCVTAPIPAGPAAREAPW